MNKFLAKHDMLFMCPDKTTETLVAGSQLIQVPRGQLNRQDKRTLDESNDRSKHVATIWRGKMRFIELSSLTDE